jgi:hypothetical protein
MIVSAQSKDISCLLEPRVGLPWVPSNVVSTHWDRPLLFDNEANRAYEVSLAEEDTQQVIEISAALVENLYRQSASPVRAWAADFAFMHKIMSVGQMREYAAHITRLSEVMPRQMVVNRRRMVARYLRYKKPEMVRFETKFARRFIRSSVLLYPTTGLFFRANSFLDQLSRSKPHGFKKMRDKLSYIVRMLVVMSDEEICARYQSEEVYQIESGRIRAQCHQYDVGSKEVFQFPLYTMYERWLNATK